MNITRIIILHMRLENYQIYSTCIVVVMVVVMYPCLSTDEIWSDVVTTSSYLDSSIIRHHPRSCSHTPTKIKPEFSDFYQLQHISNIVFDRMDENKKFLIYTFFSILYLLLMWLFVIPRVPVESLHCYLQPKRPNSSQTQVESDLLRVWISMVHL